MSETMGTFTAEPDEPTKVKGKPPKPVVEHVPTALRAPSGDEFTALMMITPCRILDGGSTTSGVANDASVKLVSHECGVMVHGPHSERWLVPWGNIASVRLK